jgi:hypothetical protein
MQTSGTALLAVERRSLVRVRTLAQDNRSAHGLLYFAAVQHDRHHLTRSKIPAVQISPWLYHRPARWVADGCGIHLHPALSISVVSKSVNKGLASWLSWPERAPAYSSVPIDDLGFRKSIASFLGLA